MSTTAAPERTRGERVGRFIHLEAIDAVLQALGELEMDDPDGNALAELVHDGGVHVEAYLDLGQDLWPDEETSEQWQAEAAAYVLAARLFEALAEAERTDGFLTRRAQEARTNARRSSENASNTFREIAERYYADPDLRASMPCSECGAVGGCEHFPEEDRHA